MEGFLITILMFSVPIVAAIIDKKLKAGRKAQPLVHAEPIIFEDEEEEEPQRAITRTAAEDPWKTDDGPQVVATQPAMPQPAATPTPAPAVPVVKTQHNKSPRKAIKKTDTESYPTAEEIRRDRRKLILYKEIMTPKFDSE
mgnify:FL=1